MIQNKYPFHFMTKPIGPLCNLDCEYCFYLKKDKLFNHKNKSEFKMTHNTLDIYIKKYIEAHIKFNEVTFSWQGGEPTLSGLDFFREATKLQKKYSPKGMIVNNALQTNGTLITDEMAIFFRENNFLIGISIDGPEDIHNRYRKDSHGYDTFNYVIEGIETLKRNSVEFNTLTVVQDDNCQSPKEVYEFLKKIGSTYLQFIPIVEIENITNVSRRTVPSKSFGDFMNSIFRLWAKEDIGKIFVGHFDMLLGIYAGYSASICVHSKTCGRAMAVEHNGNIYSCDHFVDDEYELGNIITDTMDETVYSDKQVKFGNDKFDTLPKKCLECRYLSLCYGACPKDRIKDNLNFLCEGYFNFYKFTEPYFAAMAQALKQGQTADKFRSFLRFPKKQDIRRNDPCLCLSGKKYKFCCG